jgi:hypothetical protein
VFDRRRLDVALARGALLGPVVTRIDRLARSIGALQDSVEQVKVPGSIPESHGWWEMPHTRRSVV